MSISSMWSRAKSAIGDTISDTYESLLEEFTELGHQASPIANKLKSFADAMDTRAQELLPQQQTQQTQTPFVPKLGDLGPALGPLALSTALQHSSAPQAIKSFVDSSVYPDPATSFLPPAGTAVGSVVGPFPGVKDLVARLSRGEMGPFYHGTTQRAFQDMVKSGYLGESGYPVYLGRFPEYSTVFGIEEPGILLKIDKLPTKNMEADYPLLEDFVGEGIDKASYKASGKLDSFEYDNIQKYLTPEEKARMSPNTDWDLDVRSANSGRGTSTLVYPDRIPLNKISVVDWNNGPMTGVNAPDRMTRTSDVRYGWTGRAQKEQSSLEELLAQLIKDYPRNKQLPWWLR